MFKRLMRFLFSNLLFKIFAVLLAISVWILAVLIRTHTVNMTVPIETINLPDDMVITKMNTDKISVTLQGHGTDFLKFFLHPPLYRLDLAMVKTGDNRIKFAPDELVISAPVLLKSITPEYSEITTDHLETSQVSVLVPYRVEPLKGIYITDVSVADTVILSGPEQEMRFVQEVATESLFISDYSAPQVYRKLRVVLPDDKLYSANPESVTVIASIEKEQEKIFADVPVSLKTQTQNTVLLKPKTANITLRGAKSRIDTIQISDIKVTVNVLKLDTGAYNVPAEIVLPKGIFLTRCDPKLFEVKIK